MGLEKEGMGKRGLRGIEWVSLRSFHLSWIAFFREEV
jgi:hypothetical protein